MKNITTVINKLRQDYKQRLNLSPEDINGGFCMYFAKDIIKAMDGENDNLRYISIGGWNNPYHTFIRYNGRYYDAEHSKGLKNWRMLRALSGTHKYYSKLDFVLGIHTRTRARWKPNILAEIETWE